MPPFADRAAEGLPAGGLVVVVSGPSGAGKDTVIQAALQLDPQLATIATVKTRDPRPGEIDGVHQIFLSEAEFDRWLAEDRLLEHAVVYGHRTGVPREAVMELLAVGRTVVLRTDVQGARTLKERLGDPLLVFITPESLAAQERRMRERGDSDDDIARRLAVAESEMREAGWFDLTITNADGQSEAAARALVDAIATERERRRTL